MLTITVFVVHAFLVCEVLSRSGENFRGSTRKIEVKEPRDFFADQAGNKGGDFDGNEGNNGDAEWANTGKRGLFGHRSNGGDEQPMDNQEGNGDADWANEGKHGFFRHRKQSSDAPPNGNQEGTGDADWANEGKHGFFKHRKQSSDAPPNGNQGDDDQGVTDWASGDKKKHNWFGQHKDGQKEGQKDGEKDGQKTSGQKAHNPVTGRWNKFVGEKLQGAMSAVGIKGPAQQMVLQGAVQQGVLKPEMAGQGTWKPKGVFDYLFYPFYSVLGFSHLGPLAKPVAMPKA